MASTSSSPCAACKFLRRKCQPECVFAPYFPPDQPQKFANVHKVFGASNVTKLLNELHPHQREDAVNSLAYEADMRLRDPVYGCVGVISLLQHQLRQLQVDLSCARSELSKYQNLSITEYSARSVTASTGIMGGGGGVLAAAAVAAGAATACHPHPQQLRLLGMGMDGTGGGGGGGREQHPQFYSHHQFFPSNHHQQSTVSLRGFDMAAGAGGGSANSGGYDNVGLLAMNMDVSATAASLGQLHHQQPTARAAGGDDRRGIDPS